MRVLLASVSPRGARSKRPEIDALVAEYLGRLRGWLDVQVKVFPTESALLQAAAELRKSPGGARIALLDGLGNMLSSEEFAAHLQHLREGASSAMLAIGPADGWSEDARRLADIKISLGPMTLPHELARVVAAEQLYRAWTILERHPYHAGH